MELRNRLQKILQLLSKKLLSSEIKQKNWRRDVPTLKQALHLLKGKSQVDIELKELETMEPAIALVRKLKMASKIVFTSFDEQLMLSLKQKYPEFKTGFIIGWRNRKKIDDLFVLSIKNQKA